jgi:hypothetical protein
MKKTGGGVHANMAGIIFTILNGNSFFICNLQKFFTDISVSALKITWGWIIDSGANHHMNVSTQAIFSVANITSLNIIFGHPNGTLSKITHVGNLQLSSDVVLFDGLVF